MRQHQYQLLLVHRHSLGERLIAESLGITEQPSQQFQGHRRPKTQSGALAGGRLHPGVVDHPLPSLPSQSVLSIVTSLCLTAFLLVALLLGPLTGSSRRVEHGRRCDNRCQQCR